MTHGDRRRLWLVGGAIAAANAADLASTWAVSPHLANEWNVLQRTFALGWPGLIGAKLVGGAVALIGYWCYLRYRSVCYPPPGASFRAFCRHFTFGRQATLLEMQAGIPFGPHLAVNLGYFWTGMQWLILWVALDNLLLRAGIVFGPRRYSEMGYHLFQSAVVATVVLYRMYHGNYARYLAAGAHAAVAPATVAAAPVPN